MIADTPKTVTAIIAERGDVYIEESDEWQRLGMLAEHGNNEDAPVVDLSGFRFKKHQVFYSWDTGEYYRIADIYDEIFTGDSLLDKRRPLCSGNYCFVELKILP